MILNRQTGKRQRTVLIKTTAHANPALFHQNIPSLPGIEIPPIRRHQETIHIHTATMLRDWIALCNNLSFKDISPNVIVREEQSHLCGCFLLRSNATFDKIGCANPFLLHWSSHLRNILPGIELLYVSVENERQYALLHCQIIYRIPIGNVRDKVLRTQTDAEKMEYNFLIISLFIQ